MQFLNDYFSTSAGHLTVSAEQGSAFAKHVAGDFNPIHDSDSKRFCVPGDLLFAIALSRYGLYQSMSFDFLDMVKAGASMIVPSQLNDDNATKTQIRYVSTTEGADGKEVLAVQATGDHIIDGNTIEQVLRKYVAFSGQNFPYILMPLMQEHEVMINPARPLIIYQSMSFEFDSLRFQNLEIKLESTNLEVKGKRGDAILNFAFYDQGKELGRGTKKLVLSGLRPFEADVMQSLCDDYLANAQACS